MDFLTHNPGIGDDRRLARLAAALRRRRDDTDGQGNMGDPYMAGYADGLTYALNRLTDIIHAGNDPGDTDGKGER